MKKKLLTLFVAIATITMAFGQSLTVTSPGLDEEGLNFQRGAEFIFEGTVDDYTNVDSIGCYLIYEGNSGNWSDTIHMGKITLTSNNYADTFSIPLTVDLPNSDTSEHKIETRAYFTSSTQLYNNTDIKVIEEYQLAGIQLENYPNNSGDGYLIQIKRGEYITLIGTYGMQDLDGVGVDLLERPTGTSGGTTTRIEQPYNYIINGHYTDSIYLDPSFPLTTGEGFYLIKAYTDYGAKIGYNVACRLVDQYTADSISINDTAYVGTSGTKTLEVTFYPEHTDNKTITWESVDDGIANVNSNGVVSGISDGQTKIVATAASGVTDTCIVIVGDIDMESVSVSPTDTTIDEGQTATLVASFVPTNATNKSVTWTSANTSIATVSDAGVVTGISQGSTTITVTTDDGGFTATCSVTVNDTSGNISVSGIQFEDVNIYPNPATNELNIAGLENGTYELSIYNILGVRYMSSAIEVNGVYVLPIESLNAGTYILMLEGETGIVSKKLNIIE